MMDPFELALVEAVVLGVLCGIVGTVVVVRGRVFFAQALSHATFPGAVVAAALGANVLVGSAIAAAGLTAVMYGVGRIGRQGASVASGIVLTTGFAVGALLQGMDLGVPIRIDNYLVGSILTVAPGDVVATAVILVVAVAVLGFAGRYIVFDSFDPTAFRAGGYRRWPVEFAVLGLVSLTVVVALPAVGAILTIALIAAPAAAAQIFCATYARMVVVAPIVGSLCAVAGVAASRVLAVSAGAAIALVAAGVFVAALACRAALRALRLAAKRATASQLPPRAGSQAAVEVPLPATSGGFVSTEVDA